MRLSFLALQQAMAAECLATQLVLWFDKTIVAGVMMNLIKSIGMKIVSGSLKR